MKYENLKPKIKKVHKIEKKGLAVVPDLILQLQNTCLSDLFQLNAEEKGATPYVRQFEGAVVSGCGRYHFIALIVNKKAYGKC